MQDRVHVTRLVKPAVLSVAAVEPALTGKFQMACSIQDAQTFFGFGEMKLYYSITVGDGDVAVTGLSGLYANGGRSTKEGPLEVTGPLGGSEVSQV